MKNNTQTNFLVAHSLSRGKFRKIDCFLSSACDEWQAYQQAVESHLNESLLEYARKNNVIKKTYVNTHECIVITSAYEIQAIVNEVGFGTIAVASKLNQRYEDSGIDFMQADLLEEISTLLDLLKRDLA